MQSDELGIFYPIYENSVNDMRNYSKKLKCVDSQWISIQGDYNSAITQNFVIQFSMCDPTKRSTCKDESEILRWLRRKFILTFTNQRRFDIT